MDRRPRGRKGATAVLTLAIAALFTTAFAAAPSSPPSAMTDGRWTYVLERTSTGDTSFDLNVSVGGATGEENFVAILALAEDDAGVELRPVALYHRSGDPVPQGYVLGNPVGCPQAGCGALGQIGGGAVSWRYDSTSSPDALTRVLIAVVSPDEPIIELTDAGGWQIAARSFEFRHVKASQADGVGITHSVAGADVFLSAAAEGFPGGSLAMAELPCSPAETGVALGAGSATLRGGSTSPSTTCAVEYPGPIAAQATAHTNWSFEAEGAAVGMDGSFETRLFVAEYPPTPSCDDSDYVRCIEVD